MRHDLLFDTNRFNLSEVREHFINPCCFGEDAAAWLRARLIERGVEVSEPAQEDWGWYLGASRGGRSYFIGIGGNADEEGSDPNRGEWRVMVEPHRSLRDRLLGKGGAGADDEMLALIREILVAERDFMNVRLE